MPELYRFAGCTLKGLSCFTLLLGICSLVALIGVVPLTQGMFDFSQTTYARDPMISWIPGATSLLAGGSGLFMFLICLFFAILMYLTGRVFSQSARRYRMLEEKYQSADDGLFVVEPPTPPMKPWASFPPDPNTQFRRPPTEQEKIQQQIQGRRDRLKTPRTTGEDRPRPGGKWDVGKP